MTTKIVNKKDADTTMAFRKLLGGVVCAQIGGAGYGYYWATTNLGEDAVERIMRYDKVVMPMILQYKWLEAKCEKLPKILPSIFTFSEISEANKTSMNPAFGCHFAPKLGPGWAKLKPIWV